MLIPPACTYDKLRRIGLVLTPPGSVSPDQLARLEVVVLGVLAPRTFGDPYKIGGFPSVL